jgi:hypothetical protein
LLGLLGYGRDTNYLKILLWDRVVKEKFRGNFTVPK